jgi:hypothetical protein
VRQLKWAIGTRHQATVPNEGLKPSRAEPVEEFKGSRTDSDEELPRFGNSLNIEI